MVSEKLCGIPFCRLNWIREPGNKPTFDAIYLTSYRIDDENYYMGDAWRQAFENPNAVEDAFLSENYYFEEEFVIEPDENYENASARGVLFVRRGE
jgi:hypothetical protein